MKNRRIGIRQPVDVRDIVWVPHAAQKSRLKLRRSKPDTARLVQLSYTGAAAIAPRGAPVGSRVSIALGGGRGVVIIRRSTPIAGTELENYGVEFLELDDTARQFVDRALEPADATSDWRWTTGR